MGGGGGGGGYTFKLERDYLASSIPRQPPVHKLSLNLNFRGMALLSKKKTSTAVGVIFWLYRSRPHRFILYLPNPGGASCLGFGAFPSFGVKTNRDSGITHWANSGGELLYTSCQLATGSFARKLTAQKSHKKEGKIWEKMRILLVNWKSRNFKTWFLLFIFSRKRFANYENCIDECFGTISDSGGGWRITPQ